MGFFFVSLYLFEYRTLFNSKDKFEVLDRRWRPLVCSTDQNKAVKREKRRSRRSWESFGWKKKRSERLGLNWILNGLLPFSGWYQIKNRLPDVKEENKEKQWVEKKRKRKFLIPDEVHFHVEQIETSERATCRLNQLSAAPWTLRLGSLQQHEEGTHFVHQWNTCGYVIPTYMYVPEKRTRLRPDTCHQRLWIVRDETSTRIDSTLRCSHEDICPKVYMLYMKNRIRNQPTS